MYFGPFPALIRLVPNAVFPSLYGRWSRLSCLVASGLALVAFVLSLQTTLWSNRHMTESHRRYFLVCLPLALGLGSPLAFLMSCGFIYHESILWALAWSLSAIALILRAQATGRWSVRGAAAFSACAGAALLSKVTFGGTIYLLLALTCGALIFEARKTRERTWSLLMAFSLPALCALVFQGWYNFARFGSPLKFIQYNSYTQGWHSSFLQSTGTLNLLRVPTALWNYFGLSSPRLSAAFPFAHIVPASRLEGGLYLLNYREWVASLTTSCSWLTLGALLGTVVWLRQARSTPMRALSAIILLVQTGVILSFYFITQRYVSETMPYLIYCLFCFLSAYRSDWLRPHASRTCLIVVALLCATSIGLSLATAFSWNVDFNWGAPPEIRTSWKAKFSPSRP